MIIELKPESPLLAAHVYEFNILELTANETVRYAAFPQKGSTIGLFSETEMLRSNNSIELRHDKKVGARVEILGKYLRPVNVTYFNCLPEFSINFTPLGINYFFDDAYKIMAPNNFQELKSEAWQALANLLFNVEDTFKQQAILEAFLIKQYKPQKEVLLKPYEKAIALLQNENEDFLVSEIAEEVGLNEKTLTRNMKKLAGCSPIQLKRILRFRRSIDLRSFNKELNSLTETALDAMFYDQSHFGREYRLLTGESPKDFFNSISFQKEGRYPYRMV